MTFEFCALCGFSDEKQQNKSALFECVSNLQKERLVNQWKVQSFLDLRGEGSRPRSDAGTVGGVPRLQTQKKGKN
jgi:hypothetical protein